MKKLAFISLVIFLLGFKGTRSWAIEPNYKINFSVVYWAGICNGSIAGLVGNIVFDENDLTKSVFNFGVDLTTLKTGSDLRDGHLKKEEYFNTPKYPSIIFKSITITKTTNGYTAEGNLTIKATTKKIKLPFTFKENAGTAEFLSTFKINRLDYFVGESTWKLKDSVTVNVIMPTKKL